MLFRSLSNVKLLRKRGERFVSSTQISKEINIDASQIAKDLSYVNISESKLSETTKLREKNQKQISTLSEEYWNFEQVDKIYFNRSFDFSMDLFQIPYFSWMIYISDKLKEELERNCITGIKFSIPGNRQYLVHRPNPILEWV